MYIYIFIVIYLYIYIFICIYITPITPNQLIIAAFKHRAAKVIAPPKVDGSKVDGSPEVDSAVGEVGPRHHQYVDDQHLKEIIQMLTMLARMAIYVSSSSLLLSSLELSDAKVYEPEI